MTRPCEIDSLVSMPDSVLSKLSQAEIAELRAAIRPQFPWVPNPGQQSKGFTSDADELYYGGAAGGGKALALDTPVPTPDGWRAMGDLCAGDLVFGRDGSPVRILFAHPVMHGRPCYEVEFDTGDRIVCDEGHLWLTYTAAELAALTRRNPEWRAARRAKRPSRSRVGAGRGKSFTQEHREFLSRRSVEWNREHPPEAKPAPVGGVRTTGEIAATLCARGARKNHAVPIAGALQTPEATFPLAPYLLGLWLGDGTASAGQFTTADPDLIAAWHAGGFETVKYSAPYSYGIYKLKVILRALGVLGDKHVPPAYLRGSREQRLALLQGLMDTDGYAAPDGGAEFDNTNKRLADAVYELVASLGDKPAMIEGTAKLRGVAIGPKWRVSWRPSVCPFRLPRKASRFRPDGIRRTTRFRYIVAVHPVASVPVRCLTVDAGDHLYLCGRSMIPTHNTQLLVGLALREHRDSLILRRRAVDAKSLSKALQSLNYGSWKWNGSGGELRTPDGRTIEVGGCEHETDKSKYQGQPHDGLFFDELPTFTQSQYEFIIGWNRPLNPRLYPHQRCRVVGAGNPPTDPEGEWVLRRWRAWMPGARNPARPGELRWYTTVNGEEVECEDGRPLIVNGTAYTPRSRTFIPARLEDNPELMRTGYAATLEAMPEPLRSMLRYGDMLASRQDDRWQLVPTRWVHEAQKRWLARKDKLGTLRALGVDVAMSGGDQTAIATRHGPHRQPEKGATIGRLVKRRGKDTPDGQSVVALLMSISWGEEWDRVINIDAIGIGKSAVDVAQVMGLKGINPIVVSNAANWRDPRHPQLKFANTRAAMMWRVRALLDPEGGPEETRLALPPDPELIADLCAPRYCMRVGGLAVESKDDIRERIGRSTDVGDAVALACWEKPDYYAGSIEFGRREERRYD